MQTLRKSCGLRKNGKEEACTLLLVARALWKRTCFRHYGPSGFLGVKTENTIMRAFREKNFKHCGSWRLKLKTLWLFKPVSL
jgi:hypothetical protein